VNVLIVGCGRVGARVATALSESHQVAVVDWKTSAFDRLGPDFAGETIVGNGIDVDVLRDAGVEEADLFLALTDGDNRNLMAGQIASHLKVSKVIVRVYDPVRAEIFSKLGMITVSPTVTGSERLFDLVVGQG
jgi:trk system potassium uptake protein TrkA